MQPFWRSLTPEEQVVWPKARLGGGLAILVACASVLTLIGAAIILFWLSMFGLAKELPGLLNGLFDGSIPAARRVGLIYGLNAFFLILWSALFLFMTLARAPSTPVVASVTFGLQFLLGVFAALFTQFAVAGANVEVFDVVVRLGPFIPAWLGGLMLTVGFSSYLLGGVRPNAYYRRRVAVPSPHGT